MGLELKNHPGLEPLVAVRFPAHAWVRGERKLKGKTQSMKCGIPPDEAGIRKLAEHCVLELPDGHTGP